MTSKSGHPDDDALQRQIELAAMKLCSATTIAGRRAAWRTMKSLHAQRSQREIAAREQAMRVERWALDHVS